MKRPVVMALLLCAVATLAGCPIYDHDDNGCFRSSDCGPGYSCDRDTGECFLSNEAYGCSRPSDCGVNETCGKAALCVAGDCTFSGCVSGYSCDASSGTWQCVLSSSTGAGGEGGAAGASSAGAGGSSAAGQAGSSAAGQAGSN